MLLIRSYTRSMRLLRWRPIRSLLATLAIVSLFSACLDERATYVVEHMPDCMLGCQDRCLSQNVGACQMACEETWSWSLGLKLPVCGFEWESVGELCRGRGGSGCLEVYGPKLGTSDAAEDSCPDAISTWEACMASSYVLDCRWQCQEACDAEGLAACQGACEGNWSWIDRLGTGLCLSRRNAVDAECGVERQCSAEGPIFSTAAITDVCHTALNAWTSCYEGLK
jgi:hypothetical protein